MEKYTLTVGLVIGFTEFAKKTGLKDKWLPLVAIVVGAIVHPLLKEETKTLDPIQIVIAVAEGLLMGFTVTGCYSASKGIARVIGKKK